MPTDSTYYIPSTVFNFATSGTLTFKLKTLNQQVISVSITASISNNSTLTISSIKATKVNGSAFNLFYKIIGTRLIIFTQNSKQTSAWVQCVKTELDDVNCFCSLFNPATELYGYSNNEWKSFLVLYTTNSTNSLTAISISN